MSSLNARVRKLENLRPAKPWFVIQINGDPTAQEQEQMDEAHANGREVIIFQSIGDTLGIWGVDADGIRWAGENES